MKETQLALRLCSGNAIYIKFMSSSTDKQHTTWKKQREKEREVETRRMASKLCERSTSQMGKEEAENTLNYFSNWHDKFNL